MVPRLESMNKCGWLLRRDVERLCSCYKYAPVQILTGCLPKERAFEVDSRVIVSPLCPGLEACFLGYVFVPLDY